MSTVQEICEGMSRCILDSPVNDIHLSDIASHITEWRELAPYLDLSEVEEKDIVDTYPDRPKLQRREALRKWKESNGHKATYYKLICIFCSQNRVNTAQTLKMILTGENDKENGQSNLWLNMAKYLDDCYSALPHPSHLQWPFADNSNFVDLSLFDAPISAKGNLVPVEVGSLKQLTLKSIFSVGDQNAARKVVLVEGIAGSGKSTLCWYACREWAAGRLFKEFKLLIYVSLSDNEICCAMELADLITHPNMEMRYAVAKAIAEEGGKGTCFILDSCDEAPRLSVDSFLFRFIAGTGGKSFLSCTSIILTSRPGISRELLECARITGKVVIKGFKSLNEFIDATVATDNDKRDQLIEALQMKPELYSLCHLPLHAVILVHLFDFFDSLPTTRTGLFYPLMCNFLIRHVLVTKHRLGTIRDLATDLPQEEYLSLCKISKFAYDSIVDSRTLITPIMLKSAGIDPTPDNTFGFLQVHYNVTMYGPANNYSFPHLSLQEFLAAFHITRLEKQEQITAFKQIFERNPLSSVLSFYAGVTRLTDVPEEICHLLLRVMKNRIHFNTVADKLQSSDYKPQDDIRRQILALMNCIYESEKVKLMDCITFSLKMVEDSVILASDFDKNNRHSHIELPLLFMILYPTDCLSIGCFARHACELITGSSYVVLNLSSCMLKTQEIKALSLELCKQKIQNHNLCLNLTYVWLTKEALQSIRAILTRQSGVYGLVVTATMIQDLRLALKYITEVLHHNSLTYLSINELIFPVPIVHHLVLLLHCGQCLTSLNLCGCIATFTIPRVMLLFCEALKYCKNLKRLFLDGCGINDQLLQLLAAAITEGCKIQALDIGWNQYTSDGLTQFLQTLVSRVQHTRLVVLSTDELTNEHHSLVKEFNAKRKQLLMWPFFSKKLTIACKNKLWDKEGKAMKYLLANPQYI